MQRNTNPCSNPTWSGRSNRVNPDANCAPPVLEARIYRDEIVDDPHEEGGDCLGTIVGFAAFCAVCVFGVLRLSGPPEGPSAQSLATDLESSFFKQYSDAAYSAGSQTGIPPCVLLTEAYLITGGSIPKDHNLFGYGPAKTPFKAFLARATKCADALDATYTDLDQYMAAALRANLYTKAGAKQVRANLSTFKKMFEN